MPNPHLLTPYFLDQPINLSVDPSYHLNTPTLPDAPTLDRLVALYEPIAAFVAGAVANGERPVSIAGDCVTTLGVLAGLQRAGLSPVVIWLDAHGDFNTPATTPSGFLGGMPLAMAVGRGDQTIVRGLGLTPIAESQVILSDARDLDPGEREAVAESGVTHVAAFEELLTMPLPDGPLYVHFDCDVLRTADVPAVLYPAAGGPSTDEVRAVLRRLAGTNRIAAISLSTWAPDLDEDGRSQTSVLDLLHELT